MDSKEKPLRNRFVSLALLLILSRGFDFFSTYLYTPDLSNETNILVNLFHLNYISLGIIQLLGVSVVIYLLYFYCFREVYTESIPKDTTIKEFFGIYHFQDRKEWVKILYRMPSNKNSLLCSLGYILTWSLITIGFLIGTSTSLLLISDGYRNLYKYGGSTILYSLIIIIILFFAYKFYITELEKRKMQI